MDKCKKCGKEIVDKEAYYYIDDTFRGYNDGPFCEYCFKEKYPQDYSYNFVNPTPYKEFLQENLDYFYPNWRKKDE